MSRKTLRFNRFGESILSEFDLFNFEFKHIYQRYPAKDSRQDICRAWFEWSWNGYKGYGEVDFYKSTNTVCNEKGENLSNMTIASYSQKQQVNGRSNCALYNDKSLEDLFNIMLKSADCSNILTYEEWLNELSNK